MFDKSLDSFNEEILDVYFSSKVTRIFLHNTFIRKKVLNKHLHLVYSAQQLIRVVFDGFYLLHLQHFKLLNQVEYLHIVGFFVALVILSR